MFTWDENSLSLFKTYFDQWVTANNLSFDQTTIDGLFLELGDAVKKVANGSNADDELVVDGDGIKVFGHNGDDLMIAYGDNNVVSGQNDYDMTVAIGNFNYVSGGADSDLLGAFGEGNTLDAGSGNDFIVVGGMYNVMFAGMGDDLFDMTMDPTAEVHFSGQSEHYSFVETAVGIYESTDLRATDNLVDGHDTFITDAGAGLGINLVFNNGMVFNVQDLIPNNIPRTQDDIFNQIADPVTSGDYNPDGTIAQVDGGTKISPTKATDNDTDFDGDPLTVQSIKNADTGISGGLTAESVFTSIMIAPDGTYSVTAKDTSFSLAEGETVTEKYIYTVDDGNGGTNEATIGVTLTGSNDTPFAVVDMDMVDENGSVDLLPVANDTDPDSGDVLSLGMIGSVKIDGMAVADPTGLFSVAGDTFTFNALGSFFDPLNVATTSLVEVGYQVVDSFGATNDGVMNITVKGVNDDPVANLVDLNMSEDTLTGFNAISTTSDVDDGAILSLTGVSNIMLDGVAAGPGLLSVNLVTGDIGVAEDFNSLAKDDVATIDFDYTVADEHLASDTAQATFTINGENDAVMLLNGVGDLMVTEGTSSSLAIPGDAFEDVDQGDVITFEALFSNGDPLGGWLTFDGSSFDINPTATEVGTHDIKVVASDGLTMADNVFTITVDGSGGEVPPPDSEGGDPGGEDPGGEVPPPDSEGGDPGGEDPGGEVPPPDSEGGDPGGEVPPPDSEGGDPGGAEEPVPIVEPDSTDSAML